MILFGDRRSGDRQRAGGHGSEAMQGGCICENAPLLRVDTNNASSAALFAPKPLGMTSANDWTAEN